MQKTPCKNVDYQEQESIFRINAQHTGGGNNETSSVFTRNCVNYINKIPPVESTHIVDFIFPIILICTTIYGGC